MKEKKEEKIRKTDNLTYNEKLAYYQEKKNSGLALVVISAICFIVAAIFFFLSYKYNVLRVRTFVIGLEFFVAIIAVTAFATLLTLGLVFIFTSISNLKNIKESKQEEMISSEVEIGDTQENIDNIE